VFYRQAVRLKKQSQLPGFARKKQSQLPGFARKSEMSGPESERRTVERTKPIFRSVELT